MPDHVHLLVDCDPQFGIHRLMKLLKGRSSRVLRDEFPWLRSRLPTLWTNSYLVATVGTPGTQHGRCASVERGRSVPASLYPHP